MAINVFEGARRITHLIVGFWAIGVCFWYWNDTSYVPVKFSISGPSERRWLSSDASGSDCGSDDTQSTVYKTTKNGTQARATICFEARDFNGKKLIPYKVDASGMTWGHSPYSDEVVSYKRRVTESFNLLPDDEEWVERRKWKVRWQTFSTWLGVLVGGAFAIWTAAYVVGWIVRGFVGIPMGKDRKADPEQ